MDSGELAWPISLSTFVLVYNLTRAIHHAHTEPAMKASPPLSDSSLPPSLPYSFLLAAAVNNLPEFLMALVPLSHHYEGYWLKSCP